MFRIVADMRDGPRVIKASGLREDQIDEIATLVTEFYKDKAILNLAVEPEDLPFDPFAPYSGELDGKELTCVSSASRDRP